MLGFLDNSAKLSDSTKKIARLRRTHYKSMRYSQGISRAKELLCQLFSKRKVLEGTQMSPMHEVSHTFPRRTIICFMWVYHCNRKHLMMVRKILWFEEFNAATRIIFAHWWQHLSNGGENSKRWNCKKTERTNAPREIPKPERTS